MRRFVRAVDEGDEALVESEVLRLSRTWRPLAPLALCVGAFVMLFRGLRRLWSNWRLVAVEILPAMWAWAAMLDLKLHVLGWREFQAWQTTVAVLLVVAATLVTVAAFYLNAVFAFAIVDPESRALRPAFSAANRHLLLLSATGGLLGVALGVSAFVVPIWGRYWFVLALGVSVGLLMLASVVVPARLVGVSGATSSQSRRDRVVATVIGAVLGAVVCTPTYTIGRIGIVLLGKPGLVVLGAILLVIGFGLQSGATGTVRAIKMSAKAAGGVTPDEPAVLGTPAGSDAAPPADDPATTGDRPAPPDAPFDGNSVSATAEGTGPREGQHRPAAHSPDHLLSVVASWETRKEPEHAPVFLLAAVAAQPA